MLHATRQGFFRLLVFGLALGLVGLVGQTSMAQESATPGQQAFESREDYDVSILAPHSISPRRTGVELLVRVRTPQGALAHGIPVRFELDPAWQGDATIVPQQTTTDHGIARAQVHTSLIGHVRLKVRVGFGTVVKQTGLHFLAGGGGEPS